MLSFLFFILIFVVIIGLFILLMAFSFVSNILRGIFSFGRKTGNTYKETTTENHKSTEKKDKVFFDKDDAEDADYEEIK